MYCSAPGPRPPGGLQQGLPGDSCAGGREGEGEGATILGIWPCGSWTNQFVHFVKQEDWVVHSYCLQSLDDSAGHGADVRPSAGEE